MQLGQFSFAQVQLTPPQMFNYIKAHRRNWGLTQKELGYILGFDNNVRICQLELGKKTPTFSEAIIFELLFDKAPSRMFPDIYHETTEMLNQRLEPLEDYFNEQKQTQHTQTIKRRLHEVRKELTQINSHRI